MNDSIPLTPALGAAAYRAVTMGDNSAAVPLAVQLAEEAAELKARADDLLAGFAKVPARIGDEETAGKIALLGSQLGKCIKASDQARLARTKPWRDDVDTVNGYYNGFIKPMEEAHRKLERLTAAWITAEKSRLAAVQAAEQEKARAAQIAAEKAAALAALDGDPNAVESAQEQAAEAETRMQAAAQPVHVVADSGYGAKAHGRKVPVVTITNVAAACMWLIENERAAVNEFVMTVYGKRARGGARGAELPGATVTEEEGASFR